MRRRRAGAIALSLALAVVAGSTATIPRPIEPIPAILFQPIDGPDEATSVPTRTASPISDFRTSDPPPLTRPSGPDQPEPARRSTSLVPKGARSGDLSGAASWYCKQGRSICHRDYPDRPGVIDRYAAAGPQLRAALCGSESCTSWRGRTVFIEGTPIMLIDWCQCYLGEPHEKIIDLYWDAWDLLDAGKGPVKIGW